MAIYTFAAYMADGANILKDGAKMTIGDVLSELNAAAGNVTCDACGNWMEPDDPNVGIDCNLHPECAGN